jgi:nucleotide-binding universal stress UspA family protein
MKILFATDGSREAAAAIRFLQCFPLPRGSSIHIVSAAHVKAGLPERHLSWQTIELMYGYQRDSARRAVAEAEKSLEREGITVTTEIPEGDPATQILHAADAFEADLVVVGSRGLTGLTSFFLGSVARSVAKRSPRPVLVARAPRHDLRELLMATDGSAHATAAARFAARLPLPEGAHTTLIHVVRPQPSHLGLAPREAEEYEELVAEVHAQQQQAGAQVLGAAQSCFAEVGRTADSQLRVGDPAAEILAVAEERGVDLIIAGARGVSLIEGLWMGSVADRLLKHAQCSVLIVP